LSSVDGRLRVCGDICLIHELASGFCISSLVAVVVDVDVEPVEEESRRGSDARVQERKKDEGCGGRKTHIRSPSQESREELASPSREGPAGAGPVAIGVEDKGRNSRYILGEGGAREWRSKMGSQAMGLAVVRDEGRGWIGCPRAGMGSSLSGK
jgi:hypothetical protein